MKLIKGIARLLAHYRSGDFNTAESEGSLAVRSENFTEATVGTYTVPAGQRARIMICNQTLVEAAFTSTTATDTYGVDIDVTPQGDTIYVLASFRRHSDSAAVGDHLEGHVEIWLDEGDQIDLRVEVAGDAAGAGRVLVQVGMHVEEFNV